MLSDLASFALGILGTVFMCFASVAVVSGDLGQGAVLFAISIATWMFAAKGR